MRKIVFGISLFIPLIAAGCASSQIHQSLLLHENRQLEDALYVAHAEVADLRRENDLLREQQNESLVPSGRSRTGLWDDGFDIDPPLEVPKVILPSDSGTTEIPESLRGSQVIPIWTPAR